MAYYALVRWEITENESNLPDNVNVLGIYPSLNLVLRDLGDEMQDIFDQLNELDINVYNVETTMFDGSHPLHGCINGVSIVYADTTDLFKQVELEIHEVPFVQS